MSFVKPSERVLLWQFPSLRSGVQVIPDQRSVQVFSAWFYSDIAALATVICLVVSTSAGGVLSEECKVVKAIP